MVASGLSFTRAVRLSRMGTTQEKRLSEDITISEANSVGQSCNVIFLDAVAADMASEIRRCK